MGDIRRELGFQMVNFFSFSSYKVILFAYALLGHIDFAACAMLSH